MTSRKTATAVLAIRGTNSIEDVITDAKTRQIPFPSGRKNASGGEWDNGGGRKSLVGFSQRLFTVDWMCITDGRLNKGSCHVYWHDICSWFHHGLCSGSYMMLPMRPACPYRRQVFPEALDIDVGSGG